MALLVYLTLYLYLHACTARTLIVRNEETVTQLQVTKEVNTFRAGHGEITSDYRTNTMLLDNQKSSSIKEAEKIEGEKVKTSYYWKVLHQPTGTEIRNKAERSTLESLPSNTEENVRSKDNDTAEDIVVMDYAQPHRKPPIHNKGT